LPLYDNPKQSISGAGIGGNSSHLQFLLCHNQQPIALEKDEFEQDLNSISP
jgi:hypothetical protein